MLEERRTQLRALVTESSRLAVSRIYADGSALLSITAAHGLEGVVGKDRRSVTSRGDGPDLGSRRKCPERILRTNGTRTPHKGIRPEHSSFK
jgi:hypothetical protein